MAAMKTQNGNESRGRAAFAALFGSAPMGERGAMDSGCSAAGMAPELLGLARAVSALPAEAEFYAPELAPVRREAQRLLARSERETSRMIGEIEAQWLGEGGVLA